MTILDELGLYDDEMITIPPPEYAELLVKGDPQLSTLTFSKIKLPIL